MCLMYLIRKHSLTHLNFWLKSSIFVWLLAQGHPAVSAGSSKEPVLIIWKETAFAGFCEHRILNTPGFTCVQRHAHTLCLTRSFTSHRGTQSG